jgi:hypothetical protein
VRLGLYLVFVTWVGVVVYRVAPHTYFADNPMTGGLFGVVLAITAVGILQMNYEAASLRNGRFAGFPCWWVPSSRKARRPR